MNFYDTVYFSTYRKVKIIDKELPEWSTVFLVSIYLCFVFFFPPTFMLFSRFLTYGKLVFAVPLLLLFFFNYLNFIRNKRYDRIISHFSQTNYSRKYLDGVFWVLTVLSFGSVFTLAVLRAMWVI